MLREIDLPCSGCGGELVERDVDPRTLSLSSAIEGDITIAECPECGARYFPERSLAQLGPRTGSSPKTGGR
jgi:uncharacterized OB-fold protein